MLDTYKSISNNHWCVGACKLIENFLSKLIMWFPCYHHLLELVLKAYIQHKWKTREPCDKIYKEFQKAWPKKKEEEYKMNMRARQAAKEIVPRHKLTKKFHVKLMTLLEKLDEKSLRVAYKKLIEIFKVVMVSSVSLIYCLMFIII